MPKTASQEYQERLKRVEDAVAVKKPDRVPTFIDFGYMAARHYGITYQEFSYNQDKWVSAITGTVSDFKPDIFKGQDTTVAGKALDVLDSKVVRWPGHGIGVNQSHQFVENEYMMADEYDAFIKDPADFLIRTYLPRVAGALAPLKKLSSLFTMQGLGQARGPFSVFSDPEFIAMCGKIAEAGKDRLAWDEARIKLTEETAKLGFPSVFLGGFAQPPFDYFSDFLRGMKGSMLDMYRQPDKLLKAMDIHLQLSLERLKNLPPPGPGSKLVFFAPHRGAEGFMSIPQFEKFYWPGLKAIILATIDGGYTPYIFWEGHYENRLKYVMELPGGKVMNRFDWMDFKKAKQMLGGQHNITGGIMPSILQSATVQEVKDTCKELIDTVGRDGGYILSTSVVMDEAKEENVKAMIDFTAEYGVYK